MLPSAGADQAPSMSSTRIVLISGRDAATGSSVQLECVTASDRIASDVLLVELADFPHVASQVCAGFQSDPT